MSDLEINVLRALRVHGPCSNGHVGRKLGIAPDTTYPAIKALELRGLALHPKKQVWQISRLGREWFAENGLVEPQLFVTEQT